MVSFFSPFEVECELTCRNTGVRTGEVSAKAAKRRKKTGRRSPGITGTTTFPSEAAAHPRAATVPSSLEVAAWRRGAGKVGPWRPWL